MVLQQLHKLPIRGVALILFTLETVTCLAATTGVSPTSLSWASVAVGNKGAPKSVTLTNGGTSTMTIGSIAISGTNATDFTISSKTCSGTLAPSATCTASVLFAPTVAGTRKASLVFTDSGTGSPQTVALSGLGTGGTTPGGSASVSPTTLNWVSVAVGNKGAPKPVTLTNSGKSAIAISSITITGANPADFAISSKTCSTSLAASASCTATVLFAPTVAGARSATLTFTDGATNSPQTVALTGKGTGGSSGAVTVSPSGLAFPSTAVGSSSAALSSTLTNGTTATIAITSVAISGTNASDFTISAKTCAASLAAAASCTATVVFKPSGSGARAAMLNFTDAAGNSPQTVALTGTGTSTSTFSISPLNPTVNVNATVQFSASTTATWAASCGSITAAGLYTAPATAGACTVTGTSTASGTSGKTASTTVTVTNPGQLTVTPSNVALHAIATKQFTANESVTWSASCGAISSSGLFTAPTTSSTCTITATSKANTGNKASATAVITVVNYTMRKNGISQTGLQANELALTPANVNSTNFKQKWSAGVDGGVWGQPLYINGITVAGKTRNVLYVTTSNDSVYAIDADTGAQLWKTSFLSTGVTAVPGSSLKISNTTGILSTPVIDSDTHTLYVVAETAENNDTTFIHRLHALDITTGKQTLTPVAISHANLPPVMRFQRPSLLLANGMIYVGFGSIEDRTPYHGFLFAFDQNTLEQKAVFDAAGTGSQGGIWMSGAAPAADSDGDIYVSVANGTFNGTNAFGESVVKLSPTLQELDYFTPYAYQVFNEDDTDMGAGGVMVVPDLTGPFPHILIACGKPTPIYVLNRDSMGGVGSTSDNILQRLDGQLGAHGNWRDSGQPCYNTPGLWQQNVYFAANHDVLKMFTINPGTGKLGTTPTAKGTFLYQWPGADPVVSSNGDNDGIVWTVDYTTSTLHANDATNLNALYSSAALGTAVRWVPPTVANGHVYVALQGKVVCFSVPPTP